MFDGDLDKLTPDSFQHLVFALTMRVLGPGASTFCPGPDAGRDGWFEGEAPYPNASETWKGTWYIQAKFHAPHVSHDAQRWLVEQVKKELAGFQKRQRWPDNWILATNIDPSGAHQTGSFDKIMELVKSTNKNLAARFHVWGKTKLVHFLRDHQDIAQRYGHYFTPGDVLSALRDALTDERASADLIIQALTSTMLWDLRKSRLEQAGSVSDSAPGIHQLFTDLPVHCDALDVDAQCLVAATRAAAQVHGPASPELQADAWAGWRSNPERAPIWIVLGGPGQGKSTVSQFLCQIHRASLVLQAPKAATPEAASLAQEIKSAAEALQSWPAVPRLPIWVELRAFAFWYGSRKPEQPRGLATYLAERLTVLTEQAVPVGLLRKVLESSRSLLVFDGLDEVPSEIKDRVAEEVRLFTRTTLSKGDAWTLCTSRPQGYSDQFQFADAAKLKLRPLTRKQALECARPILSLGRSKSEAEHHVRTMEAAIASSHVRELATTPLQVHILALTVRAGRQPPERKWDLYNHFYEVIRAREADRDLPDKELSTLLRKETALLRAVHNQLGYELHAMSQVAAGAKASLTRTEFRRLVRAIVTDRKDTGIDELTETVMRAATERLVLISTPSSGDEVCFDLRPIQEFFAAERLLSTESPEDLRKRLVAIGSDPGWREVVRFALAALIEQDRGTDLSMALEALRALDTGTRESRISTTLGFRAAGGLHAAALVQNGSLEQDKSVRARFLGQIDNLLGSPASPAPEELVSSWNGASRAWVLDLALARLERRGLADSATAAKLLWNSLPDGDPRVDRFREMLKRFPPDEVVECLALNPAQYLWNWHYAELLSGIHRLDTEPTSSVPIRVLRRYFDRIEQTEGSALVVLAEREFGAWGGAVLRAWLDLEVVTEPVVTGEWGGVYLRFRRLGHGGADAGTPPTEARGPRLIRALGLAMRALAPDGRLYLRKLYEVIDGQTGMLDLIQKLDVPVLMPEGEQSVGELLAEVEGMSNEQWLALLRSERAGSLEWRIRLRGKGPISLDGLRAVLERALAVSTSLFSRFLEDQRMAGDLADSERRALLARGLRSSLENLARHPATWGFALESGVSPQELSEGVARQRARAGTPLPNGRLLHPLGVATATYPFPLDAARDGALVPMIALLMTSHFEELVSDAQAKGEGGPGTLGERNARYVELLGRYGSLQTFESFVLGAGDPAAKIGGAILALLTGTIDPVAFCLKHEEALERAVRAEPLMGSMLGQVCLHLGTLLDSRMLALFDSWLDASAGNLGALLKWRSTMVQIREMPVEDGLRSRIDTLVPFRSHQ